jgi:S-adenosylmethionine hydrolase
MTFFTGVRIVTLISDFGTGAGCVREIRGVLTQVAPSLKLVNFGHEIPPQDVVADFAL